MKKLRKFKCASCHKAYEKLIKDDILVIECDCGSKANRTLSAAKYFSNTVGKSQALK